MAKCLNVNDPGYQILKDIYKSEIDTNNIINNWQKLNNTDVFPTPVQAATYIRNQKTAFNLKTRQFGQALLANLRRERIGHNFQDEFYVNNSNQDQDDYNNIVYDERVLTANAKRLRRYLDVNNIPQEFVDLQRTEKTYRVVLRYDKLNATDIIEKTRSWDTPRSKSVVKHLLRLFPGVNVVMMSVGKAEDLYKSIPSWKTSDVPFKQINSFYVDGTAVLIQGRVTDETAIEEVLHPFIEAVRIDNKQLYNSLLAEASKTFPEMVQQIKDAYNKDRGFNENDRNIEIVTQALTRHFKKEYENQPTKTFLDRVKDLLEWFSNIIKNLSEYLTGRPIPVSAINPDTKMSDIAKLLNTEGIEFKLDINTNGRVKYNLSPSKNKQLQAARSVANPVQIEALDRMFNLAKQPTEEVIETLAANINDTSPSNLVVLNEENHTYTSLTDKTEYQSVTNAIKGKLQLEYDATLEIEIGNQVDALLDDVVTNIQSPNSISIEESHAKLVKGINAKYPGMKTLSLEDARKVSQSLTDVINTFRQKGDILLTQVTVYDEVSKLAGTIDLLLIRPNGKVRIFDLKTSKNSIKAPAQRKGVGEAAGTVYNTRAFPWKPEQIADSRVYNALDPDQPMREKGMTLEQQQLLQVNMYKSMLENMGYEIDYDEQGYDTVTIHYKTGIEGEGTNKKFNGSIQFEGLEPHPAGQFQNLINKIIVPIESNNNIEKQKFEKATENDPAKVYRGKDDDIREDENPINKHVYPEYNTQMGALEDYKIALINLKEAEKITRNNIFRDRTKKEQQERIASHIAYINIALAQGPVKASAAYTSFLKASIDEVKAFKAYVTDPNNFNKREFITYVLNFDKFTKTFQGLHSIKGSRDLNATQSSLVLTLIQSLNDLSIGTKDQPSIITTALNDFVEAEIRLRSNRDYGGENSLFTEEDIKEVMEYSKDINMIEYQTRDMDTSPDVLSALMAKIYKSKKQELLDKVAARREIIARYSNAVIKLDGRSGKEAFKFAFAVGEDGGRTGEYVQPIGMQYYKLETSFRAPMSDNTGKWYQYRDLPANIFALDAVRTKEQEEDIEYNKDLANKKAAFSNFSRAERKEMDPNSPDYLRLVDGDYHEYTDEFKRERDKYEVWYPGNETNEYGTWQPRNQYKDTREYAIYEDKYYTKEEYNRAIRIDGQPTGQVVRDENRFVRREYVQVRMVSSQRTGSQSMESEQYAKIMRPTDALGVAQKEWYENVLIGIYEKELLAKLPGQDQQNMIGKVPLIKDRFVNDMKNKPSLVNRLFAKTIGKDAWRAFSGTRQQKTIVTDQEGYITPTLPIFYTGNPRTDESIEEKNKEINFLQDQYRSKKIKKAVYDRKMPLLLGELKALKERPTAGEIDTDLGSSILKFAAMAENYETMGEIENTLRAFVKVIENRTYGIADPTIDLGKMVNGTFKKIGLKTSETNPEARLVQRAKKFMSMVYYDNEYVSKGAVDRIAEGLIQLSSLSYVAFNPFGNFNNYVIGRLNNTIEMLGGRYFSRSAYARAEMVFNKRALPDLVKRTSYGGAQDLTDVLTFGVIPGLTPDRYDATKPNSKYEAFVDLYRMMDPMSDLREQAASTTGGKSWFSRAAEWGYLLQDAAEYNVQTKVGMAILMDITAVDKNGTEVSLYDAYEYDSETHKNVLKAEFQDPAAYIKRKDGRKQQLTDQTRYDIRNEIREVNKQIHGNYAREDRMVMQSSTIGKLAAQFHKWVAPAIRARYQRIYFDENLGWMEGRYRSFISFLSYVFREVMAGEARMNFKDGFLEENGFTGKGGNRDQFATNRLFGFYRTMGEIGIMLGVLATSIIFSSILAGDSDDDETVKRLKNIVKYQADRTLFELVMFVPILGSREQMSMVKSPIASTRTMGEIGEALSLTLFTPIYATLQSPTAFNQNADYVYQQGNRKGELKLWKNYMDALPILYTFQKWNNYLKMQDFFIK